MALTHLDILTQLATVCHIEKARYDDEGFAAVMETRNHTYFIAMDHQFTYHLVHYNTEEQMWGTVLVQTADQLIEESSHNCLLIAEYA